MSECICVYGWDEALLQRCMQTNTRAIFVTEEPHPSNPLITVYQMDSPLQKEPIANQIAWSTLFCDLKIVSQDPAFEEMVETKRLGAHAVLSEASDFSQTILQ